MRRAMRSFTEPPGLRYSTLARIVAAIPSVTELSLTRGVFPTRSAMCSAYFTRPSSQMLDTTPDVRRHDVTTLSRTSPTLGGALAQPPGAPSKGEGAHHVGVSR